MLKILIQKELKSILTSPKFTATFAVCSLLILLSVFIGINEFKHSVARYETSTSLADQRMREMTSWHSVHDRTYRKPTPMQIFVSGLDYDIGRWSDISADNPVRLRNSAYSDDPIFAVFRFLDFTFIVTVVLSLFAIMFTYDAVNGERERGTLKLIFSNAVPRAQYILAKSIGSLIGLTVPIAIPILLSLLIVNLSGVPMNGDLWSRVALLIGLSFLYMAFFVVLGVLVSALTRHSSVSFLLSLVIWIGLVLILPRGGVMAAGQIVSVPRMAEIEGQRDGFAKNEWEAYYDGMEKRILAAERGDSVEDEDAMWARMEQEDSLRRAVNENIDIYNDRLMEDWNNRKRAQQQLGFTLARFSPAATYQLAAMRLSETDIDLKQRYEQSLNRYRQEFNGYTKEKQTEAGDLGGVRIEIDTEKGFSIDSKRGNEGLDLEDRPYFTPPQRTLGEVASSVTIDFGILSLVTLLGFVGAFAAFVRYDVR